MQNPNNEKSGENRSSSTTTGESRPESQPRRIFRSTLDALKSALKSSAYVNPAPAPQVPRQPVNENKVESRLQDIQTRIDQLPEARILRETRPPVVPFLETAHGIEKLSSTLPEVLTTATIAETESQRIPSREEIPPEEKFEDTSERFENEEQKMSGN